MYYRQLDALRFVAVTMVLLQHWFSFEFVKTFYLGLQGVLLFFALSGFLITNILLKNKQEVENGTTTNAKVLKTFYFRRTLRIFPIYYLTLIFLYLFSFKGLDGKTIWYALYASNIYTFIHQKWDGIIGPLWSLAVEEQFYLVWPFLILLVPAKRLMYFFIGCILSAPVLRLIAVLIGNTMTSAPEPHISMIVLMPCCIDCFAFGGLLAYILQHKAKYEREIKFLNNNALFATVFIAGLVSVMFRDNYFYYTLFPTLFSFFAILFIYRLVKSFKGITEKLVTNSVVIYLGKISYGLYLYHGPFPFILAILDFTLMKVAPHFSLFSSVNDFPQTLRSVIWIVYLVIISSISYFFIEKPLNKLKEKFAYK
ncbi:MAG: acyltransferase 3 [Segetibacter sp.]|nr:acyltransferase 3 [Segetibacter sp.]